MISILTPTRGRPKLARRMYESAKETADNPDEVSIWFAVDQDDPELANYKRLVTNVFIFNESTVGKLWNKLNERFPSDIVMMGNDDLIFKTKGWDTRIKEETLKFEHDIYVLFCNDGINGEKHCAFPFVSRKWIDTLGYFTPECFNFFFHDTWIFDIGKKASVVAYLPDVLIEHMHFTQGKSAMDETYKRQRIDNKPAVDGLLFKGTEWFRDRDVKILKGAMK